MKTSVKEFRGFKVGQEILTWWDKKVKIIRLETDSSKKPIIVETEKGKTEYYHFNQVSLIS